MIEAMACGTPVIAFRNGSVPEVVDDGVTGFIVDDEDAGRRRGRAASPASTARRVRRAFEQRFTARRMAEDYVTVYRGLIARERPLKAAVGVTVRIGAGCPDRRGRHGFALLYSGDRRPSPPTVRTC